MAERSDESGDIIPVLTDRFQPDATADQRLQAVVVGRFLDREQPMIGQVADPRRKTEPEQVA